MGAGINTCLPLGPTVWLSVTLISNALPGSRMGSQRVGSTGTLQRGHTSTPGFLVYLLSLYALDSEATVVQYGSVDHHELRIGADAVIDKLVDGCKEGLKPRGRDIERDYVGFLSGFEGTDRPVKVECPGRVDGHHLQHLPGRKQRCVTKVDAL